MNDFRDSYTEIPMWVKDYNLEYKKHRNNKKKSTIVFYLLAIIAVTSILFLEIINVQYIILAAIVFVLFFIISAVKAEKYPFKSYEFLSSFIYETGFLLYKNDDPKPQNYVDKINTLLGNWYFLINKIEDSIFTSFYVINIKSFCNKSNKLIMLLNEYSKNHNQYSMNKTDISMQLIELANSIYGDKENINKHIELTDLLIAELQKENLKGKPINISLYDLLKENINKILIMTPQYIKLPIAAIIIFSVVFILIYIIGLWINIEKEPLFIASATVAMLSIPIVMPLIKKQD